MQKRVQNLFSNHYKTYRKTNSLNQKDEKNITLWIIILSIGLINDQPTFGQKKSSAQAKEAIISYIK